MSRGAGAERGPCAGLGDARPVLGFGCGSSMCTQEYSERPPLQEDMGRRSPGDKERGSFDDDCLAVATSLFKPGGKNREEDFVISFTTWLLEGSAKDKKDNGSQHILSGSSGVPGNCGWCATHARCPPCNPPKCLLIFTVRKSVGDAAF